jgi:hypothetical protein
MGPTWPYHRAIWITLASVAIVFGYGFTWPLLVLVALALGLVGAVEADSMGGSWRDIAVGFLFGACVGLLVDTAWFWFLPAQASTSLSLAGRVLAQEVTPALAGVMNRVRLNVADGLPANTGVVQDGVEATPAVRMVRGLTHVVLWVEGRDEAHRPARLEIESELAANRLVTSTGFDPTRDGFANFGDGNCLGAAETAAWWFDRVKAGQEARPLAEALADDRARFSGLAKLSEQRFQGKLLDHVWPSGRAEGLETLTRLAETGQPQILSFDTGKGGHSVLAYGFERGHFLIFDSNFPGETIDYDFDLQHGFGSYRWNGQPVTDYGSITGVVLEPTAPRAEMAELYRVSAETPPALEAPEAAEGMIKTLGDQCESLGWWKGLLQIFHRG